MKYLFLLALPLFFSQASFAHFVQPDLEEASRYEYSEFQGEQTREVAGSKKEEKKPEKERDVASDQPIQDASSESGVKFWKY